MDPQATLLVVDDNAENRDMLSRRLARRGFDVRSVTDGPSALDEVARGGVDLVLLDIMMPEMDGLEVLERLRNDHSQAELPVIMVTAKDESTDVVRALDLGANDYITKPIDFAVVLARVQKELRTSTAFRARDPSQSQPVDAPVDTSKQPTVERPGAAALAAPKPAAAEQLGKGVVLADRYRLGRRIGSGNFGTVYRGKHLELGLPVAVKVLQTQMGNNEEALARFRAEGRSACLVQHPNAVTVFDFGITDDGVAFMVMELLEGHALSQEQKRHGQVALHRLGEVVPPVAAVLTEAHARGIVHRDVKPDNIYLHRGDRGEVVKVLDFGIAKLIGDRITEQNLTAEGFILGTPAFMAPERLRNQPYDGRSDVYSLGVTLYQLLAGELPFRPKQGDPMAVLMMHLNDEHRPVGDLAPAVPATIASLVDRCLAKNPEDRPGLAELSAAFATFADPARRAEEPLSSYPPTPPGLGPEASTGITDTRTGAAPTEISDELPTRRIERVRVGESQGFFGKMWRRLTGD